ncbi:DnaB-like helicase N-terminal domain-containing protein, partial [Streptosporangium sp. NPDC003464]
MGDRLTTETDSPLWDREAEQTVLGTCMTVPYIVGHIRAILPEPRAFRSPQHQIIYAAILDLVDQDGPTDTVAVKDYLQRAKTLGQAGGHEYLLAIDRSALIAGDPAYHARIVLRHWRNRESIYQAHRTIQELQTLDPDDGPDR